jgi:hypothetical protein
MFLPRLCLDFSKQVGRNDKHFGRMGHFHAFNLHPIVRSCQFCGTPVYANTPFGIAHSQADRRPRGDVEHIRQQHETKSRADSRLHLRSPTSFSPGSPAQGLCRSLAFKPTNPQSRVRPVPSRQKIGCSTAKLEDVVREARIDMHPHVANSPGLPAWESAPESAFKRTTPRNRSSRPPWYDFCRTWRKTLFLLRK